MFIPFHPGDHWRINAPIVATVCPLWWLKNGMYWFSVPKEEEDKKGPTIWIAIGVTAAACVLLWILLTAYKKYRKHNAVVVHSAPPRDNSQNINRQRPARRRNSVCDVGPQQPPSYGQMDAPPPYPPPGQPHSDPIYSPGQPPPYTIPETPPPPYDQPENISSGQKYWFRRNIAAWCYSMQYNISGPFANQRLAESELRLEHRLLIHIRIP